MKSPILNAEASPISVSFHMVVWDPFTFGLPTHHMPLCLARYVEEEEEKNILNIFMKIPNQKAMMKRKSMISVFSRSLQTRKPARGLPIVQYPAYNDVCAKYGLLSIDKPIS